MGYIEGMGRKLVYTTDKEKFEQNMLAISPEDADLIKEFTGLLFGRDMMGAASLKPKELRKFRDYVRMMWVMFPLFKVFKKYS